MTAKKLERYFLDHDKGYRHRRSATPSFYDVIFVVDASNSIRKRDFNRGVKALRQVIDKARPNTHFAAITFSDKAEVAFDFTDPKTAKHNLYHKISFIGHKTNTQEALKKCRTDLFTNKNSNVRPHAAKRVLLLTDGSSNMHVHLTLYRAFQLKMMGVEIFVIAIGSYMPGIQELVAIASSTDKHLYRVRNTMSLLDIVRLIPAWKYIQLAQRPWVVERYKIDYENQNV